MCKENTKYSMIDKKVYDWLLDARIKGEHGFCIDKFKADFIVDNLMNYNVGDKINTNSVDIKIIIKEKNCYKECPYYKKENKSCPLKKGVSFGE